MKIHRLTLACAALLVLNGVVGSAGTFPAPPSPRDVLGIDVGADRVLASYTQSERYLRALAAASGRVRVVALGPTVEGRTMVAAVVSSAANVARLEELRAGWARVADPRGLDAPERERLIAGLPSCALITAGIHANEVAGPQAALLLAYRLAAAPEGSPQAQWLDRMVLLIVPSLNPDGQEATVAWYRKWLGTAYEGSQPPFLYHRYAGHDNNRDFVYLTQPESRALNRFVYRDWHPQLFLDLHMMGPTGPRQFVPPFADPIAPNVHPFVWRVTSHLGTLMSLRLEEAGKSGVVSGWTFDGNWIGGTRNTGWWKNVFGVLTETAGAALATPIRIDENELHGGGKGLVAYRPQVNFPNPWRGGTWGLADAVSYQLVIMNATVEFAATQRAAVLRDVATMAAQAAERGANAAPRAYLVPPEGDPARRAHLVRLLLEAGVEGAAAAGPVEADGVTYPAGTVVFPAAQPLRQYLLEVMERQRYPEIAPAPDADILLPYDVTAWTMPLELGVRAVPVAGEVAGKLVKVDAAWAPSVPAATGAGAVFVVPAGQLGGFAAANRALQRGARVARLAAPAPVGAATLAAGSFVIEGLAAGARDEIAASSGVTGLLTVSRPEPAVALRRVRVGVYHPNFGLEDAGWLRFVLEGAAFDVEVVGSAAVASGEFARNVDVLVLPPLEGKTLVDGPQQRGPAPAPPEFRRGIGKEGVEAVRRFFAAGGTVIAFGPSADWLSETLELPVTDTLKGAGPEAFRCPGALLDLAVDRASPLGAGLPARIAAMVEWGTAFQTRPVVGDQASRVVAYFPDEPLVLSGWVRGEEKLRRRAAVVEVNRGAGHAVLFAFAPYFRGQTEATFPLLFNAVVERMARADSPAGEKGSRS
ncbi:MAG: M14 family zinc carboxypeptidase [Thermoanaerobaculaceae bacterium]|nr:M14 family zinc carboxypeptidase [Thermoanaerobaculaceae bacterium]